MKKLFNFFLIGILAFMPIYVIVQILLFANGQFTELFQFIYQYNDNYVMTFIIFLASFSLFTYVGYRLTCGRSWIIAVIDAIIDKIPLLNVIYRVTKKIVNMFSGHEQKEAREVVYIEYPKEGLWVPAYVTNKEQDRYILFVPTSPNPTSGFTIVAHESKIVKSKMNIEEATSFIISVGVDYEKIDEINNLPK